MTFKLAITGKSGSGKTTITNLLNRFYEIQKGDIFIDDMQKLKIFFYILRRLIRRAVRHARTIGIKTEDLIAIAANYIDVSYKKSYPLLLENRSFILDELKKEIARFESTLENGEKEFNKILNNVKAASKNKIEGKDAFYLYDTFGFPIELTVELANENGMSVDEEGFNRSSLHVTT